MSRKETRLFLEHILESIILVKSYLKGVSREQFLKSPKLQDAVIRRIEVIGEAVRNIYHALHEDNDDIPWRQIIGMRNVLVHEYFNVDIKSTWDTAKIALPKLERSVKRILDNLK